MITKDRLNELALKLAHVHIKKENDFAKNVTDFAHALIKRIEQEAEVAGELVDSGFRQIDWVKKPPVGTKLIALPLV